IDAVGNVTTSVYDADGRVIRTIDPLGHITTNTYDMVGRRIEVIDPEGHVTTTVYDFAGRVEAGGAAGRGQRVVGGRGNVKAVGRGPTPL
ncbi:MAG TPA: YD repeat-containing protein, partial [Dermatophilaceae bacterium]|nr:YD repeat-containing protein [Dermatophilaceae bacterium]